MTKRFDEKVVVITGGSSGIGRFIALLFAKEGAKVSFCARREAEGKETLELIQKEGVQGLFFQCDVSNAGQVSDFIQNTVDKFGKIDFAVNNAAILGVSAPITRYPEDVWDKMIEVNLKGTYLAMKYEIKEMLKHGKGSIVNVSSISGINGYPYNTPYSASKHAIIGLTKSAALEYAAKGIRINAICPGGVETDMLTDLFNSTGKPDVAKETVIKHHPINRLAKPEEIAGSVLWLCSEEASFLTGATIPVDGGWSSK